VVKRKSAKQERLDALTARLDAVEKRLASFSLEDRKAQIEELILDFFLTTRGTLVKWSEITGQSAQIDTGYMAQHLASLVLRTPGQGFKGKGLDLRDGSEVKSAASVSGVDKPRWNHSFGTVAADEKRREAEEPTKSDQYLAAPWLFYVLFDRVWDSDANSFTNLFRVRAWAVAVQHDDAWRTLIHRYLEWRKGTSYNLQLHPPVGYDQSLVVNKLGNLDLSDALVLDVRFPPASSPEAFKPQWVVEPPDRLVAEQAGRAVLRDYEEKVMPARPEPDEDYFAGLTSLENLQSPGRQGSLDDELAVLAVDASEMEELPEE